MLVLTRRVGQELVIDKQIRVVVAAIRGSRVQLNISAPTSVNIRRQELDDRLPLALASSVTAPCGSPAVLTEHVVRVRHVNRARGIRS
jgi:carbon storage regulator CsrA